jgi:hypothetical protein
VPAIALAAVLLLLAGCAGPAQERVIVDTKGVDPERYRVDLEECAEYAGLVDVRGQVVTGAAGGAVLYGVLGAILDDGDTAKRTAGAGGLLGGVRGGVRATREQNRILRNCLRGRGYSVLN